MAEEKEVIPETPTVIPAARSSNFSHVTSVGNKCVDQLKKVVDQGPEKIREVIMQAMPELLQSVVEVTFEKAKIWPIIERDEHLSFYQNLKVDRWMSPESPDDPELRHALVSIKM